MQINCSKSKLNWRNYNENKTNSSLFEQHGIPYREVNEYLYQVDKEASEMYESLITNYAKAEGVNEHLKATNQMEWVQMMRSISDQAREIVEHEIIFQ